MTRHGLSDREARVYADQAVVQAVAAVGGAPPAVTTTEGLVRRAAGDGPWGEALGRAAELRAAAAGALYEATVRQDVDWPTYRRAKEAACDAEAMWRLVQTRDAAEVGRLVFVRWLVETGRLHEGQEEG
jgi:hypothetical protein